MQAAGRVAVTGATGLVGQALVRELVAAGWQVTVLSRDAARAQTTLGEVVAPGDGNAVGEVNAVSWDLLREPAPAQALAGCEAVVHLAGEPVSQRWSASAKRAIRDSRVQGTHNLVQGLRALAEEDRPNTLVAASAVGYYGARGEEPLDEEAPAGSGFLPQVCAAWEREAQAAAQLGIRVVQIRTGIVLDTGGGALAKMLPSFRLGLGGPIADGRQYVSWIHLDDLVGIMLAALASDAWSGPINATAPTPVNSRDFARTLGRVLHRPALLPVPAVGLRLLYGEMATIITTGARVLPAKALVLGYRFRHPELEDALRSALNR
jgi:uncharacterized protein (TIGR01777 family)